MRDLSIILPTCNRGPLLEQALAAIQHGLSCDYEVIVVDGASFDRTQAVLIEAKEDMGDRLVIIREDQREGFVRAANRGFAAAGGRFVTWMNDDARPLTGAYDMAIEQMETAGPDVGMLALFHRVQATRN